MAMTAAMRMTQLNWQRRTRTQVLLLRRHDDPPHGTPGAYKRGCGCQVCCRANTAASRAYRASQRYAESER